MVTHHGRSIWWKKSTYTASQEAREMELHSPLQRHTPNDLRTSTGPHLVKIHGTSWKSHPGTTPLTQRPLGNIYTNPNTILWRIPQNGSWTSYGNLTGFVLDLLGPVPPPYNFKASLVFKGCPSTTDANIWVYTPHCSTFLLWLVFNQRGSNRPPRNVKSLSLNLQCPQLYDVKRKKQCF
jgi:hypothetical protein